MRLERRLPDPLLESDRAERGNRDQADSVGRARDRREGPVVVGAQGDVGQADDEVPAVVEQQLSRVLHQLGDPRLRVLRPALAELGPPLDLGEATLELLAEVVDDALGEVAQPRLGVKSDPQGARSLPGLAAEIRHRRLTLAAGNLRYHAMSGVVARGSRSIGLPDGANRVSGQAAGYVDAGPVIAGTLRELATLRPPVPVLSLYLDLDPREFGTQPARRSAVTSLLDTAHKRIEEYDTDHRGRVSLRADLERATAFFDEFSPKRSRGAAIFAASAAEVFRPYLLPRPTPTRVVIDDSPFISALVERRTCATG